jgi:RNA polymerase sigma-70 factor (ECF subfamily)
MQHSSEQLWQAYRADLLNFIRQRVNDRDLAEDLLQDVFVKIHARLETLSSVERVQGWVYQITRNAIVDYFRVHKKHLPLPDDLTALRANHLNDGDELWRDLEACLRPMIRCLPERYQQPLVLAELEGLSLKEVADRLNLSLPGAKTRVQRGRQKLKELLLVCCQFEFDRRGKPIASRAECSCDPC